MNKILTVIESPYAANTLHTVADHLAYADQAMKHAVGLGEAVIASHLIYTRFLNDNDDSQRALGIACGLAWLHVAHRQAFYSDLGWSRGMVAAVRYTIVELKRPEIIQVRSIHGSPVMLPRAVDGLESEFVDEISRRHRGMWY